MSEDEFDVMIVERLRDAIAPELRLLFGVMLEREPAGRLDYLCDHTPVWDDEGRKLLDCLAGIPDARHLDVCMSWAEGWTSCQVHEFAEDVGVFDETVGELRREFDAWMDCA